MLMSAAKEVLCSTPLLFNFFGCISRDFHFSLSALDLTYQPTFPLVADAQKKSIQKLFLSIHYFPLIS